MHIIGFLMKKNRIEAKDFGFDNYWYGLVMLFIISLICSIIWIITLSFILLVSVLELFRFVVKKLNIDKDMH